MSVRQSIQVVTDRIAARSDQSRREYLGLTEAQREKGVHRAALSCGNLAHGVAACSPSDKSRLTGSRALNLGIVTSYKDMLRAHQPYGTYPEIIKDAARSMSATQVVAGGVPALCDGVTRPWAASSSTAFALRSVPLTAARACLSSF